MHKKDLNRKYTAQLGALLISGCRPAYQEQVSELFLGVMPTFYEMKKKELIPHDLIENKRLKLALTMLCSDSNRNYIKITETGERMSLYFAAPKKNNKLSLISRLGTFEFLNVKLGLSLVQNSVYHNIYCLWPEDIPPSAAKDNCQDFLFSHSKN